ncbi:MAG: hypothetical protein COB50_02825 [Thiotrichales bacterium]|nr:MAG: hypothetical protein COB50_02825 [Thiotrichales bacterium]
MKKYTVGEFAKLIGTSVNTLQRWDRSKKLTAFRSPCNRRFYTHSQYTGFMHNNLEKLTIAYVRSLKGNCSTQINDLKIFSKTHNYTIDKWIEDIGSSIDNNRPGLIELINQVTTNNISNILVTSKDRLTSTNYCILDFLFKKHNIELISLGSATSMLKQEVLSDIKQLRQNSYSIIPSTANDELIVKEEMTTYKISPKSPNSC